MIRHNFDLRKTALLAILILLSVTAACTKDGGGAPGGDPSAAGTAVPTLRGTVSGGGGNGCEGRTFEQYAKRISTLPEYQYLIQPLLRRMSEQGNDPLVAYLQWAADEKVWYFVPCELQKLSTEQIGLAIQSDQLALHGEHGIYIHSMDGDKKSNSYFAKRMKAQAGLLLHEMVMGARLLMKQTAKKQCTALAKKDAKLCSDTQVMAIAEVDSIDPKQALIMDAADHEAVRAMTVFLAERGSDLSTESLKATRERLGFNFPWKRAVSNLNFKTFIAAFARSRQLQDRYVVASSEHFKNMLTTCAIQLQTSRNSGAYMNVDYVVDGSENLPSLQKSELSKAMGKMGATYICPARSGRIESHSNSHSNCQDNYAYAWTGRGTSVYMDHEKFEARGVLRDGQIYDEVKWITRPGMIGDTAYSHGLITILITQEDAPRVHSIRLEAKQELNNFAENLSEKDRELAARNKDKSPVELLDVPGLNPVVCTRK